jgi:hypothetical protein
LGNEDDEYKIILQEIVNSLQTNSSLDANDIKVILISLGMTGKHVCAGKVSGGAGENTEYDEVPTAFGIPFIISFLIMSVFWIGPGLYVKWTAKIHPGSGNIDISICDTHVTENHKGFALSNVGSWLHGYVPREFSVPDSVITLNFASPLIIWEDL